MIREEFCIACPHRGPISSGRSGCLADPQKRDILVMLTLKPSELPTMCPILDSAALDPAFPGPGDIVKFILSKIGYISSGDCGCEAMRQKMNQWGWLGCALHSREIVDWFSARAAERGIEVDRVGLWGLIEAGLKDLASRQAKSAP